jgi:hypothetical protein
VRYSRTSRQTPVWVTGQALAAIARKPFPLAAVRRARSAATRSNTPRRRVRRPAAVHSAQARQVGAFVATLIAVLN